MSGPIQCTLCHQGSGLEVFWLRDGNQAVHSECRAILSPVEKTLEKEVAEFFKNYGVDREKCKELVTHRIRKAIARKAGLSLREIIETKGFIVLNTIYQEVGYQTFNEAKTLVFLARTDRANKNMSFYDRLRWICFLWDDYCAKNPGATDPLKVPMFLKIIQLKSKAQL
jgi:hypothetical protein